MPGKPLPPLRHCPQFSSGKETETSDGIFEFLIGGNLDALGKSNLCGLLKVSFDLAYKGIGFDHSSLNDSAGKQPTLAVSDSSRQGASPLCLGKPDNLLFARTRHPELDL